MRLLILALTVLLASCAAVSKSPIVVTEGPRACIISSELQNFVEIGAKPQVKAAIESGDYRLLRITNDFGLPPLSLEEFSCYEAMSAIRHYPLVSDIVNCEELALVQREAIFVATEYNKHIIQARMADGRSVCST